MKRLELEVRPSAGFVALGLLGRAIEDGCAVGAALERAVRAENERLREPLEVLAGCVEWLEAQGLAAVVRTGVGAKASRAKRGTPAYELPVRLEVDVRALLEGVAGEGDAPRGPWHVTAFALTTVLKRARERGVIAAEVLKLDRRSVDAGEALEALEAELRSVEREARAKREKVASVAKRVKPAKRSKPKDAKRRGAKRAKPERAGRRDARRRPHPRPLPHKGGGENRHRNPSTKRPSPLVGEGPGVGAPPTRAGATAPASGGATSAPPPRTKRASAAAGFGGLPDDAQPEDRGTSAHAPVGPRGISADGEYFLKQAGIRAWPCALDALTAGRRRVLAKLHPDRMGERGAPLFQRAVRGHAELVRRLAALASQGAVPVAPANSNAAPPPPVARAATTASPPPPRASAVGEWPLAR